ncbi:hypothetical protein DPMN_044559 [Dreissena polymorpha]|uniref:Uncharacterized protein n=1 Tax=Dreissena polymorpha TaxID=45954 RepID=A0A9D4D4N1_DREPO|nr:hypothetical protein DPMN_044559 [Dreissena polymorpha]
MNHHLWRKYCFHISLNLRNILGTYRAAQDLGAALLAGDTVATGQECQGYTPGLANLTPQ